jgi:hypothetical protein
MQAPNVGTVMRQRPFPEAFLGMPLDIDHIIPEALDGPTIRANLWLACPRCHDFKGDRTTALGPDTGQRQPLFNPRTQRWTDHFVGLRMGREFKDVPQLDGLPMTHYALTLNSSSSPGSSGWKRGAGRLLMTCA